MNHENDHTHTPGEGSSLLEELDKLAPIKAFDAFPKVRLAVLYHVCTDMLRSNLHIRVRVDGEVS